VHGTTIRVYSSLQDKLTKKFLVFTLFLAAFTIVPATMALIRLRRKGTSKDLRKKVVKRYAIYFGFYLLMVVGTLMD